MSTAAELKAKGNAAFVAKNYSEAIAEYTKAIEVAAPADAVHVLYSNRSACHAGLKQYAQALEDANKCIEVNPSFAKGYSRKGSALHGEHQYAEAIAAFQEGLKIAPEDAGLKKGLADVQRAEEHEAASSGADGLGKMFSDPNMMGKLAANPKTAGLVADPAFRQQLLMVQQNPSMAGQLMSSDPRFFQVMGVLMGIDLTAFERPQGSADLPPELEKNRDEIERQTGSAQAPASSSKPSPSQTAPPSQPAPAASETKDVPMKEATAEDEAKVAADKEKAEGNALYKKRQFEPAIEHYKKAWELHKDITYLNNLAAVYFEQANYEECIKTCETAVEEGREVRADFKLVAKALGRIGSAYSKKGDLDEAIKYYQKSLTEHRTPDILTKLRESEKTKKEAARQAYIDPAKAEEERAKGNELYKAGDFAASVAAYSESIKRNPADARGYTNRAMAYIKLVALPEALKDCNEAIKVDAKNVKAYIRKSIVLTAMKEYTQALEAIQQAEDLDEAAEGDEKHKHRREIQGQHGKVVNEMYAQRANETDEQTLERAMKDPEVAQIMSDPVMQSILQQAQSNPGALQDHMKNPQIRAKIQKLVAAGIIRTR